MRQKPSKWTSAGYHPLLSNSSSSHMQIQIPIQLDNKDARLQIQIRIHRKYLVITHANFTHRCAGRGSIMNYLKRQSRRRVELTSFFSRVESTQSQKYDEF